MSCRQYLMKIVLTSCVDVHMFYCVNQANQPYSRRGYIASSIKVILKLIATNLPVGSMKRMLLAAQKVRPKANIPTDMLSEPSRSIRAQQKHNELKDLCLYPVLYYTILYWIRLAHVS